jgi:hypothetical protein
MPRLIYGKSFCGNFFIEIHYKILPFFIFLWYGLQKTILLKFYAKNKIESYKHYMFRQDSLLEKIILGRIQTQLVLNNPNLR